MKNTKSRPAVAQFVGLVLLAIPVTARGIDVGVKVEPGVAIPLTSPQTQQFGVGGAGALKGLVGLAPYVDVAGTIMFLLLPASSNSLATESGRAWAAGGGLVLRLPRESEEMRLKRPHDQEPLFGAKPWVDGDALYVRSGPLDRFGVAVAAGVSFPLGEDRLFWLGPFVRFFQVVGHNIGGGSDNRDARTLIIGLSLETGTSLARPTRQAAVSQASCPPGVACPAPLRDRDGDGVPDIYDDCPDVPGPASNHGCPVYEKIIVTPDKLELREKIQFAWNSPVIEKVSHPALDEVAKALQDNKAFRVEIEGHASSEGGDEHNQTLSEQRAQAVLDYLAGKGVARDRLKSKGFSSSRPLTSNVTETGRETNRRVEFVIFFIVHKEGSAQ
ncbi:MAG: OmpA family protein [Deltaproteobacteria bacterium]|nr:MAG: OmpA family protein [Deltaproteobacteria bacterium]